MNGIVIFNVGMSDGIAGYYNVSGDDDVYIVRVSVETESEYIRDALSKFDSEMASGSKNLDEYILVKNFPVANSPYIFSVGEATVIILMITESILKSTNI
jgi:hypothetical protein